MSQKKTGQVEPFLSCVCSNNLERWNKLMWMPEKNVISKWLEDLLKIVKRQIVMWNKRADPKGLKGVNGVESILSNVKWFF